MRGFLFEKLRDKIYPVVTVCWLDNSVASVKNIMNGDNFFYCLFCLVGAIILLLRRRRFATTTCSYDAAATLPAALCLCCTQLTLAHRKQSSERAAIFSVEQDVATHAHTHIHFYNNHLLLLLLPLAPPTFHHLAQTGNTCVICSQLETGSFEALTEQSQPAGQSELESERAKCCKTTC